MCVGGCDTDLYVPFLSMTSCASLALSLSLSLCAVRQRWSEHFESGAAGEERLGGEFSQPMGR